MRSRADIFDDASRKRGPPEPTDGLDHAKRQKLGAQVTNAAPKFYVPPLKPGPHTIAELFTVTGDEALKAFDVAMLSEDLVVKIGITILQRIDAETLNQAIDVCIAWSIRVYGANHYTGHTSKVQVIRSFTARVAESRNCSIGRGRRR
jgi:hypothetical protein